MEERFMEFRGGPSRAGAERIKVSLNSRGVFYLNYVGIRKLGNPEAVSLLYDAHKRIIGIKPTEAWRPNAFPLRAKNDKRTHWIGGIPFCRHFDIKVMRTIQFNNARVGDDGILRLNLEDITIIGMEKKRIT
ncbi:MAG: hypothetical protein QUS14_02660 [Pyrinomonadaceae bacterium]|nr:hypothetical protein [Pyrinomonadaceae bacterium]